MAKKITSAKERFTNAKAATNKAQTESAEEQFVKQQNERARVGDFNKEIAKQEHKENVESLTDSLREQKENVTDESLKSKIDDVVATNDKVSNIVSGDGSSYKVGKDMSEEENTEIKQEPKENKKKYAKSMAGIWDAYKNGDIDKGTAAYFTIDALSKMSKNIGKDIGNIGAQFSGGTIDNNYETGLWDAQREEKFKNELTGDLNQQAGTDKALEYQGKLADLKAKGLSNEAAARALKVSENFENQANAIRDTNPKAAAILDILAATSANGQVGWEAYVAALVGNGYKTEDAVDQLNKLGINFNK